jgi:ribosomal protein S18 acetylase RimI-like enzyme
MCSHPRNSTSEGLKLFELSKGNRDVKRFLKVAYTVYRDDPCWVAPMLMDMRMVLSSRNPFFQHAEWKLWVVARNGHDIGRIAGIINRAHHQIHEEAAAFFGFFEVTDDPEASQLLFDALFNWAHQRRMKRILGPMNPSTNDECGLLVNGFDKPPVFMMPYNPRYYLGLMEAAGFETKMELLAYSVDLSVNPGRRLDRVAARFQRAKSSFVIRRVTRKTIDSDRAKMREIYNDAWEKNWGFTPITDAETEFMVKRLKPFLTEGLVLMVEVADEPAAFMLSVLDFNQAFQPLRGRLLSLKLPQFLFYLVGRKKPDKVRVAVLGVKKKFRRLGFESAMLAEALKFCLQAGHLELEVSWILENNAPIQSLIKVFGGHVYKTYRIYARSVQ